MSRPGKFTGYTETSFRLLVSISLGVVTGIVCFLRMENLDSPIVASDYTWHWLGARALLSGQNPYEVVTAGGPYGLVAPYIYPLTTSILALPFSAWLSAVAAASVFVALSAALLAWGVTKDGYHRLPLFLSLPYLWASWSGQYAPLLMACAFIPALGWVLPVKPTVGLAIFVYRPSKFALVGSLVFCGLAFAIDPHWLSEWLGLLREPSVRIYKMPITVFAGPLLLLAATRWRRPEARMLLVLSLVPQLFLFYDQLLLWLIPKTWKGSALLTLLSWAALPLGNWRATHYDVPVTTAYAPVVMALLFLPSLVMVLRRPNESPLPTKPSVFGALA